MGRYDVTTKHLIENHPRDWLSLAKFPVADGDAVTVVDAELSTLSLAADKLIRVDGPGGTYLAHVEFQSWADAVLDHRVMLYNVTGRWRHRVPVRSVVFMLRPEAETAGSTGLFGERSEPGCRIEFEYELVRLWEIPVQSILTGGIGALPLAPISDLAGYDLPAVVDQMGDRMKRDTTPAKARELWTATPIMMGLRFPEAIVEPLLQGVIEMEESVTYQAIIRKGVDRGRVEGLVEGRVEEARRVVVKLGTQKFGPPSETNRRRLEAVAEADELEQLAMELLTASSWAELLAVLDRG